MLYEFLARRLTFGPSATPSCSARAAQDMEQELTQQKAQGRILEQNLVSLTHELATVRPRSGSGAGRNVRRHVRLRQL